MCVQPQRVDRRRCGQQARPSTSFVDNAIDLPRRIFLSPLQRFAVWDKVSEEIAFILDIF